MHNPPTPNTSTPHQMSGFEQKPNIPQRKLIVGAAITDGYHILAAQRAYPPDLAGKWEFPGGKVEPGESEQNALLRELQEELAWQPPFATKIERLANPAHPLGYWPLSQNSQMGVWWIHTTHQPNIHLTGSHLTTFWGTPEELSALDWLPADRPIIRFIQTRNQPPEQTRNKATTSH